jgi:hypothetical protein
LAIIGVAADPWRGGMIEQSPRKQSGDLGFRSRHLPSRNILWITLGGLLILRFWVLAFFDTSTTSEVLKQFGGGVMEFLAGGVIVALFILSLVIAKRVRR